MDLPSSLVDALQRARSIGAITGAGISKESGIATYRGKGGLYDDPEEGDRTVEALSGETLLSDPDRTWRAVAALARMSQDARPNAAHLALAEIEQQVESFTLLTQNVDGLHAAAGSRNIIEIHGSIRATRCMDCGAEDTIAPESLAALESAPRCDRCPGILRPGAVLFGEMLPSGPLARLRAAFLDEIPDVVLLVGSTAVFPYIQQPILVARRAGQLTVEVNPRTRQISEARGKRNDWPSVQQLGILRRWAQEAGLSLATYVTYGE